MCDGGGEGGWLFRGQGGFTLLCGSPPQPVPSRDPAWVREVPLFPPTISSLRCCC